jgi:hypothetical protein
MVATELLLLVGGTGKLASGGSGVEDLALLRFELGVGEHAGISQLAELLELGQLVVGAGRGGWLINVLDLLLGRRGLFGSLLLFLGGPPSLLAMLDASSDGARGSCDNCGSCDASK